MLLLSYRNEARKIPCEQQQKKIVVFVAAVFLIFRKRFYIFSDKILKLHSGFFFFLFILCLDFLFRLTTLLASHVPQHLLCRTTCLPVCNSRCFDDISRKRLNLETEIKHLNSAIAVGLNDV